MAGRTAAAAAIAFVLGAPAWSQIPAGPDFGINAYTTDIQQDPVVAADAAGNFVVVWSHFGGLDGSLGGIFGRRYDTSGATVGPEYFQVNAYTTGNQRTPAVAADQSRIVAVWQSYGQDGAGWGLYGRQFDAVSGVGGTDFPVNTYTTNDQWWPGVGMDASGNFVVVWQSPQDGDGHGIFGQRFSSAGLAEGPEFRVNSVTTGEQTLPAVAMGPDGRFLVVWQSAGEDGNGDAVVGQHYDAAGAAVGGNFPVNAWTTGAQSRPAAAADGNGDFMVVWESAAQDASYLGVFGRRYDASGTPQGGEFQVNTITGGDQRYPDVASGPRGTFVVAWQGFQVNSLGKGTDVFGRRFDRLGALGADALLNAYSTDPQRLPSIAAAGNGDFVAVWSGFGPQDPAPSGVFGRRFIADAIFRDGLETGTLDAWSAQSTGGGDLAASADAAMKSSGMGLRATIDDTEGLYVQDDTPQDEPRYRARFYLDPSGFDPGEAQAHRRTRVLIAFSEAPTRRVAAVVLRRLGGAYSLMARARRDDNTQVDTGFFDIAAGPHVVEIDLARATSPDALDGSLELWIDGVSVAQETGVDNSLGEVDFVRMGALSVKSGAGGTMAWDEFESRRQTYVGP